MNDIYDSNLDADLKAFAGQKRLAEMLYQQNLQAPQGGMVGNVYVGASPWQFLGNLANQYVADEQIKDIESQEKEAIKKDRLADILAMTEYNQIAQGSPAVPATADKPAREAIPGDEIKAIQRLLMGGKNSQAYAMEVLKRKPNWDVTTQVVNGMNVPMIYDKSANNPYATLKQFGPASYNEGHMNLIDKGIIPKPNGSGIGINPNQNGSFGQINVSQVTNDPRLFATAAVENPQGKNITSTMGGTAHGLFQINKGTFETVAQTVPELRGVTFEQFKADPKLQGIVGSKLHDINDQKLSQSGIQPDPITRQATWFTGNTGLAKAAVSPEAQNMKVGQFMTADQIKANPDEANKTVGQWRNDVANKIAQAQQGQPQANKGAKYDLQAPSKAFVSPQAEREFWADANKPLTGESLKITNGAQQMIATGDKFEQEAMKWKKGDVLDPSKKAWMEGVAMNALLAAKDTKGLGVLNGPDMKVIQTLLRDPSNIENILLNKDVVIKLIQAQKMQARDAIQNEYMTNQRQMPEFVKNKLIAIDEQEAKLKKSVEDYNASQQQRRDQFSGKGKPAQTTNQADTDLINKWLKPKG